MEGHVGGDAARRGKPVVVGNGAVERKKVEESMTEGDAGLKSLCEWLFRSCCHL